MRVAVVTGPVHTGKTSRLLQWCGGRSGVDGLLAPIIGGHRHLVRIAGGDSRDLESLSSERDGVRVGPFTFSETVFAWGRAQLLEAARRLTAEGPTGEAVADREVERFLVVDEYGKLELKGKGLEPAVGRAIALVNAGASAPPITVVLVIREGLVEPSLARLGIDRRATVLLDFPS